MRSCFLALAIFCLFLSGCTQEKKTGKSIAVGIAPISAFVQEIAGKDYSVITLLPEGKNPHDYMPGMRELAAASQCRIFFTTKLPFETRLLCGFSPSTRIVDVTRTLKRRPLDVHHHHHLDHDEETGDPHVWLSLDYDIVIAQTICFELCQSFPEDAARFQANAKQLQQRLADKKRILADQLAPCRGQEFFVFHGAFGYFADTFGLKQISVEVNGRESDPARLAEISAAMKKTPHPVLFVQKEFSPTLGDSLREQCGATLVEADPLAADLFQLFDLLGNAIAGRSVSR